eukprot:6787422-Pyramimonas_sp.AAC.1
MAVGRLAEARKLGQVQRVLVVAMHGCDGGCPRIRALRPGGLVPGLGEHVVGRGQSLASDALYGRVD